LKESPNLPGYFQYLRFHLSQGQCRLGPERKQAVCSIPAPKTHQWIREFQGAAGFFGIWIPNYSLLEKPLYEVTKRGEEQEKALKKLRGHSQIPLLWACQMW
jgi:hypothetical protein